MIVEWVGMKVIGLLQWMLDLLPEAEALDIVIPGPVVVGYTWLNDLIPVDVFLQGALLYFGTMVVLFGGKLVLTVYRLLPFKFT